MNIRNFVIIAHIDHGKSTLADRFLEITGTVEKRKMREQFLDMHPLEREKGITIKMQPVRMQYKLKVQNEKLKISESETFNLEHFILNLIDTPGHVDFSYEVSRALAAVEGAILLVDATQGIQAQTLANLHMAQKENLVIIPAINKIDLSSVDIKKTEEELVELLGVIPSEIFRISAKTGIGVEELLQGVIARVPPPRTAISKYRNIEISGAPLRALIFDSVYDAYQGVVAHIRIFEGILKKNERLFFKAAGVTAKAEGVGIFLPDRSVVNELGAGQIGYVATGLKEPEKVRVGDTIIRYSDIAQSQVEALSGYQEPAPLVFSSVFPENQDDYESLRESLKKLKLNDASLSFEPEKSSETLGRGFRAGFLGMLHLEIISERLRREYGLKLVFTTPSVSFQVRKRGSGEHQNIYSAETLPPLQEIEFIEEPLSLVEIITPPRFLGVLMVLINEREGKVIGTSTLSKDRLLLRFEAPLREIIIDFYDQLKSVSQGFASMSYELIGYRRADLVRLNILVAGEKVMALSEIIPRVKVYTVARVRLEKLKEFLPRELFAVALQAEVEGRIIARETIPALRKDVTGYLYGGDRTRKMKLWKKQQKGKKKLKEMGHVEISTEVFLKILKSR